jgi:uncharacterized protein YcfJ
MMRIAPFLILAAGLAAGGNAHAQSYPARGDAYGDYARGETYTDYARVLRVDPVIDGRYDRTTAYGGQRCYESTTAGRYERDDYDTYRNDGYRNDGYDAYGRPQVGTTAGRNIATIAGGIAGAVIGSKVGGGSGTYAATAIGSMVGGMAGRQIYEQTQRDRYVRPGVVRVCDPEPVDGRYGSYRTGGASAYDVTYEYNGRQYTRRMDYHPGDRIRVRVDVSPE